MTAWSITLSLPTGLQGRERRKLLYQISIMKELSTWGDNLILIQMLTTFLQWVTNLDSSEFILHPQFSRAASRYLQATNRPSTWVTEENRGLNSALQPSIQQWDKYVITISTVHSVYLCCEYQRRNNFFVVFTFLTLANDAQKHDFQETKFK